MNTQSRTLLSSVRNNGDCPCPRCLIPKSRCHLLGTKRDKSQRTSLARVDNLRYRAKISSARDLIYIQERTVDGKPVQHFLKPQSLVPTEVSIPLCYYVIRQYLSSALILQQNAFSSRLSHLGFNLFSIFLVDFMHEFELGVWKKVFLHLLRILDCIDGATSELDRR